MKTKLLLTALLLSLSFTLMAETYKGLKFVALKPVSIGMTNNDGNAPDLKYSLNGGITWIQWDYSAIELAQGDEIYFKGNNPDGFSSSATKYSTFTMTDSVAASGNIMSLIDNGACNTLEIPCNDCFRQLFKNCIYLTSAPDLPATTLEINCYAQMFHTCKSLTKAPELPATELAESCYSNMFGICSSLIQAPVLAATTAPSMCYANMFGGCISLKDAPDLPATTLGPSCYYQMFLNCSTLTVAPDLLAPTLKKYSYYHMFYGCTSLMYVKCLAIDISAQECTANWLENVATTGVFFKAKTMDSWTISTDGIPSGWTIRSVEAPSSIDVVQTDTKANKFFRDGQVLIQQGDKTYNAQGARVK